jgi:hypothetical protein
MSAVFELTAPVANEAPATLADLAHALMNAKLAEEGAKRRRVELEDQIIALADVKDEGSTTVELANGFKLTTTGKLTYKVTTPGGIDAIRQIAEGWTTGMCPLKTKTELDETGCKWLRANAPHLWAQIAPVIEVKPAKTAVKVGV